jgi:hypothetical protein
MENHMKITKKILRKIIKESLKKEILKEWIYVEADKGGKIQKQRIARAVSLLRPEDPGRGWFELARTAPRWPTSDPERMRGADGEVHGSTLQWEEVCAAMRKAGQSAENWVVVELKEKSLGHEIGRRRPDGSFPDEGDTKHPAKAGYKMQNILILARDENSMPAGPIDGSVTSVRMWMKGAGIECHQFKLPKEAYGVGDDGTVQNVGGTSDREEEMQNPYLQESKKLFSDKEMGLIMENWRKLNNES